RFAAQPAAGAGLGAVARLRARRRGLRQCGSTDCDHQPIRSSVRSMGGLYAGPQAATGAEEAMNDDLSLTPMGANLIKHFEGCLHPHGDKYKAYKCPANVTTIGWGTTSEHGHPIGMDTVWTKAQCDAAFL